MTLKTLKIKYPLLGIQKNYQSCGILFFKLKVFYKISHRKLRFLNFLIAFWFIINTINEICYIDTIKN